MRVAMVQGSADPDRDGVAGYTANLGAALREAGIGVETVEVGGGAAALLRAARRLRAVDADVVHAQFAPSAFGFSPLPGLLPDVVDRPLVTTLHEYGWWAAPRGVPGAVWRALESRGRFDRETWRWVPASAATVTTTAGHARVVAERFGGAVAPPVPIPLAPNVPRLAGGGSRAATRRRLGVPADATVVTFFGFVHPVKGVRYLIEAVARLRRDGRDVHLLVLGGFTSLALPPAEAAAFRAELQDRARDSGVAAHVTMTGHLPAEQVSAALGASDAAAFPFTAGATTKSGALLSAFAHGLPVLVTRADPPDPELVDGRSVVVVPRVRDADALADGLERLLADADLRARVAAGGAALGDARTWSAVASAHRDLYARVLARTPERTGG